MRVNIYAEEMTDRIEIIEKEIEGSTFRAVRFYLELPATFSAGEPATVDTKAHLVQHKAPFIHRPGDDDSSAVTFWGKQDLEKVLEKALTLLRERYPKTV